MDLEYGSYTNENSKVPVFVEDDGGYALSNNGNTGYYYFNCTEQVDNFVVEFDFRLKDTYGGFIWILLSANYNWWGIGYRGQRIGLDFTGSEYFYNFPYDQWVHVKMEYVTNNDDTVTITLYVNDEVLTSQTVSNVYTMYNNLTLFGNESGYWSASYIKNLIFVES